MSPQFQLLQNKVKILECPKILYQCLAKFFSSFKELKLVPKEAPKIRVEDSD
jgi:hypothetical protein